jgi:glycogen synthase
MDEANPFKRYYYCLILGLDAVGHADICLDGQRIDMTSIVLKTSDYIGTVSRAMKARILAEPNVFRHSHLFSWLESQGRFFGRRNGFHMAARQRFWFRTKKSILETYDKDARKRLFAKYTRAKKLAKPALQSDPNIRLKRDDEKTQHVIFAMLHRVCKQKGFELLVDWKVYEDRGRRWVTYEPWKMMGQTVLEYFLSRDERIQFVICGRIEDSFDGRRFDMHFRRIAWMPEFAGRFAYSPEGSLSPSLYRNVYVGSQYFVMPSGGEVGEPCGISQQEAHAGGTPVIAHHQDGLIRTVSDRDFGDRETPPNGIKFSGFYGEALLEALLDAVEVYFKGQRLSYVDKKGRPRKLRYSELSYNAFTTDHRWLRLLRDYIQTYREMAGTEMPPHIDAIRLAVEMAEAPDHELPDIILISGMQIAEAADYLVNALGCPIASVNRKIESLLVRLYGVIGKNTDFNLEKRLSVALTSENTTLRKQAERLMNELANTSQSKQSNSPMSHKGQDKNPK